MFVQRRQNSWMKQRTISLVTLGRGCDLLSVEAFVSADFTSVDVSVDFVSADVTSFFPFFARTRGFVSWSRKMPRISAMPEAAAEKKLEMSHLGQTYRGIR